MSYMALQRAAIPGATNMATGLVAAACGIAVGLTVAWLRGVPWDRLPALLRAWRTQFAAQCAWAAVSCASLAVLVYY